MATSTLRVTGRPGEPGPVVLGGLLVVITGAILAASVVQGPVVGLVAVTGLVIGGILLANPRFTVAAAVVVVVVCEANEDWGIPIVAKAYDGVFAVVSPVNLLWLAAFAAVVLDAVRRGRPPKVPEAVLPTLLLVVAAFLFGFANGHFQGIGNREALVGPLQQIGPLFLFPFLIVNVVEDRQDLRRWLAAAGALAAFKAIAGLGVVWSGLATPQIGDDPLTYFGTTPNLFLVGFVMFGVVALLARLRLPAWVWWSVGLAVLCVVLGYRRAMWLGFAATLPMLVVVASGRYGRRLIVPVVATMALIGYAGAQVGAFNGLLSGSIGSRLESIDPKKVVANDEDRYRLAERRNVVREIRAEPLTGIGFGVPWRVTQPLNFAFPGNQDYAHIAALWWWMKAGLLGLAAYIALVATGLVLGFRVWARHPDALVRCAGLAAAGTLVALLVVELATTTTGPDERWSVVFGTTLGLLSVAVKDAVRPATPADPSDRVGPG